MHNKFELAGEVAATLVPCELKFFVCELPKMWV